MIKKTVIFFSLLAALFGVAKIYQEASLSFCLSNICYEETSFSPKEFAAIVDPEKLSTVKKILNQNYSFLGKGNQSYAFISEDSQYVLKFFKFGHLKQNFFLNFLPKNAFLENFLNKKLKAQEERFFKVFEGYHVAYTEDPENCALIYIHLNKTDHLQQSVTVKDNFKSLHTINLDSVVFIVQEKVVPTRDILGALLKKGDVEGAKLKIKQLFSLYLAQYKKGLYDRDHNLAHNTGFKDDKAIRLDVGKFKKDPSIKDPLSYKKDLEKIAFVRLKRFVSTYYPQYKEEICHAMEEELAEIFTKEFELL
ncbi:MAG TPA: hypothetical protein PLC42_01435 [Parachlamydiaceae bacterium]|nr:hypothetical protein [Parachlamydiaceae bacterium]